MNENKEALICIMRTLNDWFSSKIKKIKYNRTLFGTITEVLTDGYQVNIAGQNHEIKSNDLSIPVMTQVKVELPCNSWENAYINYNAPVKISEAKDVPIEPITGITSTNVQDGIEELKSNIEDNSVSIANIEKGYLPVLYNSGISSLANFWKICEPYMIKTNAFCCFIRFMDSGGWTGYQNAWYRAIVSAQNKVGNGKYSVDGSIILFSSGYFMKGNVSGGTTSTSDLSVSWQKY